MSYRTVTIKLLPPTAKKRQVLEEAQRRYSMALEAILRACRPYSRQAEEEGKLFFCPREVLKKADDFQAQPFKDALQRDAQGLVRGYLTRKKREKRSTYPVCRTEKEDLERILSDWDNFSPSEIYTNLDKYDTLRPVSFCRYAGGRDYSILRGEKGRRYYGKVYLLNRSGALEWAPSEDYLTDICTGEILREKRGKRRYLLLPLDAGAWQREHLLQVEKGLAVPKNALLFEKNGAYYLSVRLWYRDPVPCSPACTLGVGRTEKGLCLCAWDGEKEEFWHMEPAEEGKDALCRLAGDVCRLASRLSALLVVENTARGSKSLPGASFSLADYRFVIKLLCQRAPVLGLPSPVPIAGSGLYQKCPVCAQRRQGSGRQGERFFCVSCGHSQPWEQAAAAFLARSPGRYQSSRLRVKVTRVGGFLRFRCPALEVFWQVRESSQGKEWFCRRAMELLEKPDGELTPRQRSVKKKLQSAPPPEGGWFYFV